MENCIKLKNIRKSFGKAEVLHGIDLNIPGGIIYGLLGPSGCGKTTTVKIMTGIIKATSGEVMILDTKMPSYDMLNNIGYMAQSDALYETLTAKENLKFYSKIYGMNKKETEDRIAYVMETVNLTGDINKLVKEYSGGMKRRLSLAIALLANPKILVLDEPTVGIDPLLRKDIWNEFKLLTDQGITLVVTTHVMDEAEKCNVLSMIRDGLVIATGTPMELITNSNSNSLEEAFIKYGKPGDDYEN
jgi:ABC-2 type transport system ATP-binding protein